MNDIKDIRLQRLRQLLVECGGKQTRLSKLIRKSPSQISQWFSGNRTISEESARDIEARAKKPLHWLDRLDSNTKVPAPATPVHPLVAPAPSVADVVQRLAEMLESMPDEQLPAVVEKLTTLGKSPDSQKARAALIIALGGTAPAAAPSKRTGT